MHVIRTIILLGFLYEHAQGDMFSSDDGAANKTHNGTEDISEDTKMVTVTATPVGSQVTENNLMTSRGLIAGPSPSPKTVTSSGGTEPPSTTDFRSSTRIVTMTTNPSTGAKQVTKTAQSSSTLFTHSTVPPSPVQTTQAMKDTAVVPVSSSFTEATAGMSSEPSLTTKTMVHVTQKPSAVTSGSTNQHVLTMSTSATKTTAIALGMSTITTTAVHTFQKPFNKIFSTEDDWEKEGKDVEGLDKICQKLLKDMQKAECTLKGHYGENKEIIFEGAVIQVSPTLLEEYYKDLKSTPDNTTLIAILASCSAVLAMIIGLAVYAVCHRKANRKDQQHLTEELQTVENGYHDNPTLEVMEVQPEMQEKVALSGELNNSWIVPSNSLLKEDMPDEEDTHL
ncbi:hypothetical protein SKAU_G00023710 [Synaphobranchus kaupii]|uniref:Podocalyxin n=1 Tax=Synaphobranchus kaupii TaxID=118154 RepID=A0A9Q1GDA9_SYNKA|nr:hypothetical protein SKAU_G00023710 [Synaphobranchus kaupii]